MRRIVEKFRAIENIIIYNKDHFEPKFTKRTQAPFEDVKIS